MLHEEVAAKPTEQTNRHLHALSILTARPMPPTLVVGAFGMILDLPFVHGAHGFAVAMALCLPSSASTWLLRRRIGAVRP